MLIMGYASEDLIALLRKTREGAGMTQRELSQRSGVTQSHISQIESGKLEPGLSSFMALARALDLEPALVPRKLVPAVAGLLRAHAPLKAGLSESTRHSLSRALKLIESRRAAQGESPDLERVLDSLNMLRIAPLTAEDAVQLEAALRMITKTKSESPKALSEAADVLTSLRNKVAHGRATSPRPAYGLDEDDLDA
jgi:transcriptional regulator with XRE-family HTH domain